MKRDELPEVLFKKVKEVGPYPNGVKEVRRMLDETAFFPGGRGLWLENNSRDFPSILVLGQGFSTIKIYDDMMEGTKADLDSQTWKNWEALRTPNIGLRTNVRFKKHSCICVALEHTSFRNVNVKRRVHGNYNGHEAEVEMLKDALKQI